MTITSSSVSSSSIASTAYKMNDVFDLWPIPNSPHLAGHVHVYGHNLSFDDMCLKCAKKYGGDPELWAKVNKYLKPFFRKQRKIKSLKFTVPTVIYSELGSLYLKHCASERKRLNRDN